MYSVKSTSAVLLALCSLLNLWSPATAATCTTAKVDAERTPFTGVVRESFKHWDTNHDGRITSAEIEAAVPDHNLGRFEAAALATLKQFEVSSKNSLVVTPELLTAYERAVKNKAVPAGDYDKYFVAYRRYLARARRELVLAVLIHLNTVHKGNACDCPIFSMAASLQGHSEEELTRMISKVGCSTYKICAPGKPAVTLNVPSRTEIACTPQADTRDYWQHRLESACCQLKPAVSHSSQPIENFFTALAIFELIPQLAEHESVPAKAVNILSLKPNKSF